jgi:hypothetical protein
LTSAPLEADRLTENVLPIVLEIRASGVRGFGLPQSAEQQNDLARH